MTDIRDVKKALDEYFGLDGLMEAVRLGSYRRDRDSEVYKYTLLSPTGKIVASFRLIKNNSSNQHFYHSGEGHHISLVEVLK